VVLAADDGDGSSRENAAWARAVGDDVGDPHVGAGDDRQVALYRQQGAELIRELPFGTAARRGRNPLIRNHAVAPEEEAEASRKGAAVGHGGAVAIDEEIQHGQTDAYRGAAEHSAQHAAAAERVSFHGVSP